MALRSARIYMTQRRLACIAVVCSATVVACGSPATVTTNLTLAQARAAVQNYDRVDAQASARCSATLNDTVESGDLAAIDDANDFNPAVCAVRGAAAAPSPNATPAPIPDDELIVPRTTSYPALLMQYADTDLGHGAGPQPNIWVLEAPTRGAPWKARAQVVLTAGPLLRFRRDAHGNAPAPLAAVAPGYRLTPAATCDLAARYYTALYNGVAAPPDLSDPSNIAQTATRYRSDDGAMSAQGVVSSRTWTCEGTEIAEPTTDGDALVVFTLRGAYSFTPPTNETFWLNIGAGDGKTVQLVPPGLYKHATASELFILAVLVPAGHASTGPQLIGGYAGIVGATSTPA